MCRVHHSSGLKKNRIQLLLLDKDVEDMKEDQKYDDLTPGSVPYPERGVMGKKKKKKKKMMMTVTVMMKVMMMMVMMQTCFTKMREQNIVRRHGKNCLESHRMINFMDYGSQNDIKISNFMFVDMFLNEGFL